MRRIVRSVLCLVLCFALLGAPVFAAQENTPEALLEAFIAQYGLDESNFAVSYCNLATGARCAYNADAFLPVGGVWTLPLHMYYNEQEALGAFDPPIDLPDEVYTIDGLTLEDCRYRSILLGEEDVARSMREALGSMEQYQLLVNESFGHYAKGQLPDRYLNETCYSAAFLMNCLQEIHARQDTFGKTLQNYRLVQSAEGFAAYEKPYELVHILGEEDGMLCDVGEIAAPQTYLLVCFVSEDAGGKTLLAELNARFADYAAQGAESGSDAAEVPAHTRDDSDFQISTTRPRGGSGPWIGIVLGAVAALALLTGAVVIVLRKGRRNRPR